MGEVSSAASAESSGEHGGDIGTVSVGESFTSFDQVEAVERGAIERVKQEKTIEAQAEKELNKGDASGKKIRKDNKDGDEGTVEEVEPEADSESESEDESGVGEEEVKLFKVKAGEKEINLTADSLHEVKIDGEVAEVTYQDLLNGYAGQTTIRNRFSDIDKQKKQFNKDAEDFYSKKQDFDENIGSAVKLLAEDPMSGILHLAELSGVDSSKFLEDFNANLMSQYEDYYSLSDDEKKLYETQLKNQQMAKKIDRREEEFNKRALRESARAEVTQLTDELAIDPSVFKSTFREMEDLQKKGYYQGEITPKSVANVVVYDRTKNRLNGLFGQKLPHALNDQESMNFLIEQLIVNDPLSEIDDEDIMDIASDIFLSEDQKMERNLSKKAFKAEKTNTSKPDQMNNDPQNIPLSFDDI